MQSLPPAVASQPASEEAQQLAAAARTARRSLKWSDAALLFTQAADRLAEVINPHDTPTANETGLRRSAWLCLNRTTQFQAHRERQRKLNPHTDFRDQWQEPTGDLVKMLLEPRARSAS